MTAMKTRITELFGIDYPIIQGGMHYVGFAELAAAVSNAGGLGMITGLTQGTPEKLDAEIKRCHDMTDIPFVASGGVADGRALMAALAFGADGVNLGTRFVATQDAPVHANVKHAIVAASELDTRLVMRPLRNTERVLNNPAVERVLATERAKGEALEFSDITAEVAGVYPRAMVDGEPDAGAWSCGMVAGLIRDIPTVEALITRMVEQAHAIQARQQAVFAPH